MMLVINLNVTLPVAVTSHKGTGEIERKRDTRPGQTSGLCVCSHIAWGMKKERSEPERVAGGWILKSWSTRPPRAHSLAVRRT
jgi:hypothetical protein